VLHVALDENVAHVRAFYDTVFEELTSSTHLEDAARVRTEVDRRRSIRSYPAGSFSAAKLREAAKFETEAGSRPELVIVDGFDIAGAPRDELQELRALAGELEAEIWLSTSVSGEGVQGLPAAIRPVEDLLSVVLALEPGDRTVALRALKDHDSPDLSALHVALDPKTLLLKRS